METKDEDVFDGFDDLDVDRLVNRPIAMQGTAAWQLERLGKVTASRFKDVMTKGRGKATSKTRLSYMHDLIAETLTGRPLEEIKAKALEWGNENEPEARATYSFNHDVSVRQVGFMQHPTIDGVGCSLDGIVGVSDETGEFIDKGTLELKCPYNPRVHLENLLNRECPDEYKWQVQGGLWITGMEWCDFGSFDPRINEHHLQLVTVRVHRDDDLIEELEEEVIRFKEQLDLKLEKLRRKED